MGSSRGKAGGSGGGKELSRGLPVVAHHVGGEG